MKKRIRMGLTVLVGMMCILNFITPNVEAATLGPANLDYDNVVYGNMEMLGVMHKTEQLAGYDTDGRAIWKAEFNTYENQSEDPNYVFNEEIGINIPKDDIYLDYNAKTDTFVWKMFFGILEDDLDKENNRVRTTIRRSNGGILYPSEEVWINADCLLEVIHDGYGPRTKVEGNSKLLINPDSNFCDNIVMADERIGFFHQTDFIQGYDVSGLPIYKVEPNVYVDESTDPNYVSNESLGLYLPKSSIILNEYDETNKTFILRTIKLMDSDTLDLQNNMYEYSMSKYTNEGWITETVWLKADTAIEIHRNGPIGSCVPKE